MNAPALPHFGIALADIRAGPAVSLAPAHYQPIVAPTRQFFYTMPNTPTRILALDPTTKGFGYVIFELPFRLVAWGLANVSGDKYAGAIARFRKLLDHSQPHAVVLEDAEAPGSRRRHRVRRLIESLIALTRERGIAVYTVARSTVLDHFSKEGERATKYSIALILSRHFPELVAQLPPRRKAWMTQDERMAIFDALALAVTHASV
jgi:hypothetical protein